MKKKWLCLFVLMLLLTAPLSGLARLESERLLARSLTEEGKGAAPETMLALSSAVLERAGGIELKAVHAALGQLNYRRGFRVNARAARAAQAAFAQAGTAVPACRSRGD
ncbi:MAG: hypothetical protein RR150_12300 [Clostridia bacterium]